MVGFCSSTVSSCVQGFQLMHGANAIGFSCISKRFAFLNHWIYHWLVGFCSPLQIALSDGPSYLGACCKWWQGRLPTCGTEPDAGLDVFFWQNIRGQGLCNRVVKTQSDQHIQSSLRAPIAEWILVIVHFKVHRLDQRQHYAIPTILTGDIVLTTSCNYLGGEFLCSNLWWHQLSTIHPSPNDWSPPHRLWKPSLGPQWSWSSWSSWSSGHASLRYDPVLSQAASAVLQRAGSWEMVSSSNTLKEWRDHLIFAKSSNEAQRMQSSITNPSCFQGDQMLSHCPNLFSWVYQPSSIPMPWTWHRAVFIERTQECWQWRSRWLHLLWMHIGQNGQHQLDNQSLDYCNSGWYTAGDILLDQQESQDISGSEMNLASSPEKDLQIEIEGWLLNYQFVSSNILPRHLNFWLQWIAHPLAYTGQQWLKHAEETHLSEFQRITRSNSKIQGRAPAQRGPVCERKKDSNVKDAKWRPVQHHFE